MNMGPKELWVEVVSRGSQGPISEMSTIISLPPGSRLPQILKGQDFTVIIVDHPAPRDRMRNISNLVEVQDSEAAIAQLGLRDGTND